MHVIFYVSVIKVKANDGPLFAKTLKGLRPKCSKSSFKANGGFIVLEKTI